MIERVDIKAGELKYWQRIELGRILTSTELDDTQRFLKAIECMVERELEISEYVEAMEYFQEIVAGITLWVERENSELQYTPTTQELQAGIEELSKEVGDFGTANELAKNYGKTPEEVLDWEYHVVFAILRDDAKKNRYRTRLTKIMNGKYAGQ